jgi:stage V sporulation protein G
MEISNVRIWLVNDIKLKAYVSIVINEEFMIRDIKIIQADRGLLIAMPNKKIKNDTYMDVAHPINSDTRVKIEKAILEVYSKKITSKDFNEQERISEN